MQIGVCFPVLRNKHITQRLEVRFHLYSSFLIYLSHLLPLSPLCSQQLLSNTVSFWLWPVLLYFSWWSPRRPQVSASVSRPGNVNTPTEGRGVELSSSLLWNKLAARPSACNTTPSDWILEWLGLARYCRRVLLSHCRGMSAAEAAPGCRLCLPACVCVCSCVSLVAAAGQRSLPGRPERIHNVGESLKMSLSLPDQLNKLLQATSNRWFHYYSIILIVLNSIKPMGTSLL